MRCLKPVKIYLSDDARKKRAMLKELPPEVRYATFLYVPCGKCEACQTKKRMNWFFRLKQELEVSESCYFVTLTYDDDKLPHSKNGSACVCKRDVQLFLKRFRKMLQPFTIRYFLVSEYGGKTLRPHYHMILFNFPQILKSRIDEYLERTWDNGFITVSPISDNRINYVCSYCLDNSILPKHLDKNFMLCSRRPAIGANFLDNRHAVDFLLYNGTDQFPINNGLASVQYRIPRYYSDKLFDDYTKSKITSKYIQEYADSNRRLHKEQYEWLLKNGYSSSYIDVPFEGSPLALEMQKQELFKQQVRNKCKNKSEI